MIKKTILLTFTPVIAILLSGCFNELPTHQYTLKQAVVAKPAVPQPAASTRAKGGVAKSAAPKADIAGSLRLLEKSTRALEERLDIFEQRLIELEKTK